MCSDGSAVMGKMTSKGKGDDDTKYV